MAPLSAKLVLVGATGVGKTTFVTRHATGGFEIAHVPTLGVSNSTIQFCTSKGPVDFNVWDCAGAKKFEGLGPGYWLGMDCAIVMFSHTSAKSYLHARELACLIHRTYPRAPIVVCGTQFDAPKADRRVSVETVAADFARGAPFAAFATYYDVSALSNYNFEKPFLSLAQSLFGGETEFVACRCGAVAAEAKTCLRLDEAKPERVPAADERSLKLVLVGGRHVGKTAFVARHTTGDFSPDDYRSTSRVEAHKLEFDTNKGLVKVDLREGYAEPGLLTQEVLAGVDGALVMFSYTSAYSYLAARNYVRRIRLLCPLMPVVVCGSKVDTPRASWQVTRADIAADFGPKSAATGPPHGEVTYLDVSASSNHNFEKPFLVHAQHRFGADTVFVASDCL